MKMMRSRARCVTSSVMTERQLRDLTLKNIYFVPRDDLVHEVLIPCLSRTRSLSCMFGYFGSGALADLAPGLAEYLTSQTAPMRLLVSPNLEPGDLEAIREGVSTPAEVLQARLVSLLGEARITESALVRHTLECLSYLLASGRLDVRVAFMREGLFHDKVWIFSDPSGQVVVSGSSNLTRSGLLTNHEQVRVEQSWESADQLRAIADLTDEFEALWESRRDYASCVELPVAVRERLLKEFHPEKPPDANDFEMAWRHDYLRGLAAPPIGEVPQDRPVFTIPTWLEWRGGDFAHQGFAVEAWEAAGRRGILEMATGSGKTITALVAGHRLAEDEGSLLIVIAAPTLPLVEQWADEARLFSLTPVVPHGSRADKLRSVEEACQRLAFRSTNVEAVVVTHDLLCDEDFQNVVARRRGSSLLVADEVHNLGRAAFVERPPDFFGFRLGLSATPVRQYDEVGTDALLAFFGDVVFRYGMDQAIGRALVPYDYYVHPVRLGPSEIDEWQELTHRLRQQGWKMRSDDPEHSKDLQILLNRRRRILETANEKIDVLRRLLQQADPRTIKHTLIYATDKAPEQLEAVNAMLADELGVRYHQITSTETQDGRLVARIVQSFRDGSIQVLTAKRVLDEGVNVPEIATAYILASTTVERQWVQRRGRVLRRCDAIGKDHAVIHDFLVLPPRDAAVDEDIRKLLRGELERIGEFARLSRNAGDAEGARAVIQPVIVEYFG